jgi:hypothetical protein
MIKIKGTIPAKVLAIFQAKQPAGKPGEGCTQIPMSTKNFDGNRLPSATKLQKYLQKMGGFHWGLFGSPLVARLPDGALEIYDGGHRVAMLQMLYPDLKTFPGTIIDVESKAEVSRLFHRVNGSAASFVSAETRFINEVLGEEDGIDQYINVLRATGVTVYESEDNYVPNSLTDVAPKWKINVKPLQDMVDSNSDDTIWALNLYTRAWGQHTGDSDIGIAITGQILKALHLIKDVYRDDFDQNDMLEKFEDHFTDLVSILPSKGDHLFHENKHDRMELRHYGTAFGIMQRFCSWGRNQKWAPKTPKIDKIKDLYTMYDKKKKSNTTRSIKEDEVEYA